MRTFWQRMTSRARFIFRLLLLFAVARVAVGIVLIALDSDRAAWGVEATLIVIAGLCIYLAVALAVRARSAS
jgi:hypothetical protein